MIVFAISVPLIFLILNVYFRIAGIYGIVDVPNNRSSHKIPTIRGAGIIFPITFIASYFLYEFNFYLLAVTVLISIVGFSDDIIDLRRSIRLLCYLLSTLVLGVFALELNGFYLVAWCIIGLWFVNAYNFMDGINGITAFYSLVNFVSIIIVYAILREPSPEYVYFQVIALLIFGFYNFRKNARCFLGDVGSIFLGFLILYFVTYIVVETGYYSFVLFITVYGLDSISTILIRLSKRENIFEAHRSHLYQILVNSYDLSHLRVSTIYGLIQLLINVIVILNFQLAVLNDFLLLAIILLSCLIGYLLLRVRFSN